MVSKEVLVVNETGIHARPATIFVQAASKFKSNITLNKCGKSGNGKSMINVLALSLSKGSNFTITADGEDEDEALNALVGLIESKFGEA